MFRDAEATRPDLAAEGGAFIAAMYVAEQDAQARGFVGTKLRAHRRKQIRPIVIVNMRPGYQGTEALAPWFDAYGVVAVMVAATWIAVTRRRA